MSAFKEPIFPIDYSLLTILILSLPVAVPNFAE